jgi:hypothetical protein
VLLIKALDLLPLFVEVSRDYLNNLLWRDLYHRPKRVISVDLSNGTEAFYRTVIDFASAVGPDPTLLVPFDPFGEEIAAAAQPFLGGQMKGFDVSYVANMPSGGGTGYRGTIGGVHVYSAQVLKHEAILCSRRLVRVVNYGVVHGESDIADFSFICDGDPKRSRVRLKFAQYIEWAHCEFVEFKFTSLESVQS